MAKKPKEMTVETAIMKGLKQETRDLTAALLETMTELEDIYRPFRPKRQTRATIAIAKGLEPLAKVIMAQKLKDGDINELAKEYVNAEKKVETVEVKTEKETTEKTNSTKKIETDQGKMVLDLFDGKYVE
mgnify:CR=1 FL=1